MKIRSLSFVSALVLSAAVIASILLTPATAGQSDVQEAWVRNYTSGYDPEFAFAEAVAVDVSGNVYVTGSSYGPTGNPDYATIKYSSSGDTLWVRRYNGPADNFDLARALAVDTSGNVYVTGESYGPDFFDYVTIKYSSSGIQEWVARFNARLAGGSADDHATALAVDASGNVYVTGDSAEDYATVKYNTSGTQQWVARYDGGQGDPLYPNTHDHARAVAVDGSGNVYVTGDSGEGSPNLSDYVTVKYNSSGVQQWAARYDGGTHNHPYAYDYATDLALDAAGNVYVTGSSFIRFSGAFWDYATVKYDARGRERWVRRYNIGFDELAYALAVDASGNVYVTGESGLTAPEGGTDYGTVKYDTRGKQQWVALYNGPGNALDVANAIAVDGSGNVYVTGESRGSDGEDDFATVKYNASGLQDWVARYNGLRNSFDSATALAVDTSGNVYVTGRSFDVGWSVYTTIKYTQVSTAAGQDP